MQIIPILILVGALVVGFWVFGLTLSLIPYALSGLVVGALGRLVLPGKEHPCMGIDLKHMGKGVE